MRKISMQDIEKIKPKLPENVSLQIRDGMLYPVFCGDVLEYANVLHHLARLGLGAVHYLSNCDDVLSVAAGYPIDYQMCLPKLAPQKRRNAPDELAI